MIERTQTSEEVYESMKMDLRKSIPESVVPDVELKYKAGLVSQILELKHQKNAVILGHNYMEPVLFHTVPDFRGDSLELSKRAAETSADTIVFCGVHFMAETAKILNPSKKVLIPSLDAGCSLAEGIKAKDLIWLREKYPHLPIVTYVNTTADVKALSDVCCSSGNVNRVIDWARKYFNTPSVIFLPDKYMAGNVARDLSMDLYIPKKNEVVRSEAEITQKPTIVGWDARCYVHEQYTKELIRDIRTDYPGAVVLAHPECPPDVISNSDFSGSTSAMTNWVTENGAGKKIALLTECSMADNIVATHPELNENLIRMCNIRCKFMHTITLEQTLEALIHDQYEVTIPEEIRAPAEVAVRRMMAIN
jgi:quinolinate synthase